MPGRDERKARNEALFREANERLRAGARQIVGTDWEGPVPFLCECPRPDCGGVVLLTLSDYRRIRADPQRAFVKPGHEDRSIERITEENDDYVVVEKHGRRGDVMRRAEAGGA